MGQSMGHVAQPKLLRLLAVGPVHTQERLAALPIELCEYIIDIVASMSPPDQQTLLSCSLVCRAWLSRSQVHIFRGISLQTPGELRQFVHIIERRFHLGLFVQELRLCPEYSAAMLLEMTEHLLAPRLPEVSTVAIRPPTHTSRSSIEFRRSALYSIVDWIQRRPRDMAPSLKCVNLTYPPQWLGARFCSVTVLKLSFIQFDTLTDFGSMLRAFPNLSILHCVKVHWSRWYGSFEPFRDALSNVTEIYLRTNISWLPGAQEMITSAPASLHTLAFSAHLLPDPADYDLAMQRLGVERLTSLVNLHLIGSEGAGLHHDVDEWMSRFLAHVTSPKLRQIKLEFPLVKSYISHGLNWLCCSRIDDLLSGPLFSQLDEVVFELGDTVHCEKCWRVQLRNGFPRLYARGIMRVVVSDVTSILS